MAIVQRSPVVEKILSCAIAVHRELGPGLLESSYERCFSYECTLRGIQFRSQVPLPIIYREIRIDCGYRLDFLIEDSVIVEIKSVERLLPLHQAQLIAYLKLAGCHRGLLINFNVPRLMDGVKSILLDNPPRVDDSAEADGESGPTLD
jgi:GxxExxY protein